MKKLLLALLGIAVLSVWFIKSADADTITWYRPNFPPVSIPDGPHADTGYFDRVEQLIVKNLSSYKHKRKLGNAKRILGDIRNQKKIACAALFKTPEREAFTEFSIPALLVLPNGVIVLESKFDKLKPFLNANREIDLDRLLGNGKLRLGICVDRRYSGTIDSILRNHTGNKNIYVRYGADLTSGLLSMMIGNRIDYILGYPTEVSYFMNKMKIKKNIRYIPVANMEKYSTGYVGLPKNKWGKEIISKINAILEKHRATPEFLSFYEKWLNKDTTIYYRKITSDYFENHSAPSQ
ncbi:MAG: TIGR02285 family protein [Desulfobacterales bacterium]|nr:TIGR02285 family protein [Desulfobacterales bacterium]